VRGTPKECVVESRSNGLIVVEVHPESGHASWWARVDPAELRAAIEERT
jgi:hypothetical protein